MTDDPKKKRRQAIRAIRGYLMRYRARLVFGSFCLIVTNALLLANPWILKLAIDELEGGIPRGRLSLLAGGFVGITVVSGLFRFLMRRVIIGV